MLMHCLILPDNAVKRARLTVIICVLTLFGCQPQAPSSPSCRIWQETATDSLLDNASAAACLIRIDKSVLMIRHRLSGKLDLPAGGSERNESARCTAHRETWEETGFNLEVGKLLTYSSSGMPIFQCTGDSSLQALADKVAAPDWSQTEVTELLRVNPFDINDEALRVKDDLIPLRDAYILAGEEQAQ